MNPNSCNVYKAYNVINPFYREKCSVRNEGFRVSLVDSLYAARQHTVQNKEREN